MRCTRLCILLLAVLHAAGLPARTEAAQSTLNQPRERRSVDHPAEPGRLGVFLGLRWTPPPGLRATESWTVCPLRCVVYEGPEPGDSGRLGWPLLVIFEPFAGSAEDAIDHWVKSRIETSFDPPQSRSPFIAFPFRARQGRLAGATFGEGGKPPRESGILIAAWENNGVSVPFAIWAHRPADWSVRAAALSGVLDTLTIDRARIENQQSTLTAALSEAARDIEAARAAGATPQLFFGMDLVMKGGIATGAAAPMPSPEDVVAVFLPGGVFVPSLPRSLAKPDLAAVFLREAPPRWKSQDRSYVVTYPSGRTERYQALPNGRLLWRKSPSARQENGLREEVTLHSIDRLTTGQLAGTYRYSRSFSAFGFPNATAPAMVAMGGSERTLTLRPDGTYLLTGLSTAGASGSPVLARGQEREAGRWTYDSANWMLELTPSGRPPSSAVAFNVPFNREAAGGDEWIIYGATWRRLP